MTNFLLIGFVELIVLFLAMGLILRVTAQIQPRTTYLPSHYPPKHGFLAKFTKDLYWWLFLICLFMAIFGFKGVTNGYYDYLATGLLFGGLGIVWITAVCILGLFFQKGYLFESKFGRFLVFSFFLAMSVFTIGGSLLIAIPDSFAVMNGLVEGPKFSEGMIQHKTVSTDRTGPNYYVDIDGQHFHVPNGKWWQTFTKGEKIAYMHNSYSDGFSKSIFHPDEINFTLSGMIIITTLILLWGMTIWASISGYVYFIFHKPVHNYHYPGEISSYSTPQSKHHQAENSNKQSSCLPVLGVGVGLAAVLLLVWKKLFTQNR